MAGSINARYHYLAHEKAVPDDTNRIRRLTFNTGGEAVDHLHTLAVVFWGSTTAFDIVPSNTSVFGFYARRKSNGDCIVIR